MSKKTKKETIISGKVLQYNLSPKGHYEGMLIESNSGTVQVNFPKDGNSYNPVQHKIGKLISIIATSFEEAKERKSEHPVYDFKAMDGKKDDKNPKLFDGFIKGKVISLNYALHGEVNGAIIDSGDFVHVKPEGADAIKLKLGQEISVEGKSRPTSLPHLIIEAHRVNGTDLDHKHKYKRKSA